MNYKDYIIFDFETTSKYPETTQPVQIAAVVVHGRKLEVKQGSEFQSLMRPVFDEEECKRLGLDPLSDESIAIHGKTREMLEKAPSTESVWQNFAEYVSQYNFRGTNFTAPIASGYNIKGFDMVIVDRLCCKAPYNLGPRQVKKNKQNLFNSIHQIDMMDFMFALFENNQDVKSLSADNLIRGYMGYNDTFYDAHDAMGDVIMTAELFCRVMKMLRFTASKKNFKNILKRK